ncbi:MAG: 3-hydroxybutyryl-CoA dehydrogenase [Planctomycetes bacterium]|jgi:3-hydroxybutyryl-CoA dehydrogenase|nr:3-hydroxybutyryl-CoA dehydrogenase [Planctomycetota bacterium]MCP4838853.1 3-hydroxybutyryl-CoA dehydrogenase [Planctomycetota bacterium]
MLDVNTITVIGAGTMGSGIAITAAMAGIDVCQVDVSQEQLEQARGYHEKTLGRNVAKERMTQAQADATLARIGYATETCKAAESQFAIEAATENEAIKKKIFAGMVETYSNDCILATNTSSISIGSIAKSVGPAADRVIGMHFFNPVPVMKLVEVIKCEATSRETLDQTMALGKAMGKTPIAANDHPGFVSNRVLMPMINEAFHAWNDGVADPESIDGIMKLGCAFPMGPLRLADLIGLDVCRDIMLVLHNGLGHPDKYKPCDKLVELVESGRLGNKTGWGVYDYREAAATA